MKHTTLFKSLLYTMYLHTLTHCIRIFSVYLRFNLRNKILYQSFELPAMPTSLSMLRSSLNLSRTVPFMALWLLSCSFEAWTIPQHSITSGCILLVLERLGLPNVVHSNVWPWSKLADTNRPKWLILPPNPMPFGMFSDVKLVAHCAC